MTIDPEFIRRVEELVKSKMSPEDRANLEADKRTPDSIRAAHQLFNSTHLANKAEHLSDDIKKQIFLEHLKAFRFAIQVEQLIDICDWLSQNTEASGAMLGLALVEFGKGRAARFADASKIASTTVLQNLSDLVPDFAAELAKTPEK